MRIIPANKIFCSILLLCAAACILQPVMAENGTITIAYRGSGGSYIGETVVFDGRNTYGNTTLIKITGPNLPSDGVQVNNLNAPSGTATSVGVDPDGMWKYVWYASAFPVWKNYRQPGTRLPQRILLMPRNPRQPPLC